MPKLTAAKLREEARLCREVAMRLSLRIERQRLLDMAERHETAAAALEEQIEEKEKSTGRPSVADKRFR